MGFLCNAQKKITYNNQQWLQYFNQLKFSEKLSLYSDLSLRKQNNFNDWSRITFRSGLGYPLTKKLQGITGIACFIFYTENKVNRIELRPYQEINTTQIFGKVSIQHRFRVEARYFRNDSEEITNKTNFNLRFRYRLNAMTTLINLAEMNQDRKLLMYIGDEIFINAGHEIKYNVFDNNRALVGLIYQDNPNLSFSFGYINQFGKRNSPATYENSDILTFAINQKISLLKSKTKSP
jgi:hypothetical protein